MTRLGRLDLVVILRFFVIRWHRPVGFAFSACAHRQLAKSNELVAGRLAQRALYSLFQLCFPGYIPQKTRPTCSSGDERLQGSDFPGYFSGKGYCSTFVCSVANSALCAPSPSVKSKYSTDCSFKQTLVYQKLEHGAGDRFATSSS